MTTGGGPGLPAILRSLKQSDLYDVRTILCDINPATGNFFLPDVDARYIIPPYHNSDFIESLISLVKRENVDYFYSGLDEEIPVISANQNLFEQAGCKLLIPSVSALEKAWDKALMWKNLNSFVRQPRSWLLSSIGDGVEQFNELSGRVIIKVSKSRGGRLIFMPENREEFDFYLNKARRLWNEHGNDFLIQEFIEGDEYNVSTLFDLNGQCIYAVSRRKFETRKIKSTTTAAVIERNDDVIKQAISALEKLGLNKGFNNVEIIVSKVDGLPYLIEINGGRTAAQDMNIVASGINVTDLMISILKGRDVQPVEHPVDGLASLKIRMDMIVNMEEIESVNKI